MGRLVDRAFALVGQGAFPKEAGTRKLKQAVKRSKERKQRQKANQAICQRRRKQSYEEFQKEKKSKEK